MASYGVDDPVFSVTQLAQTTMRSAIGKMTLDKTFMERDTLNAIIVEAINDASSNLDLLCLRYEIRNIYNSTILLPWSISDPTSMMLLAMSMYKNLVLTQLGKTVPDLLKSHGKDIDDDNPDIIYPDAQEKSVASLDLEAKKPTFSLQSPKKPRELLSLWR